MLPATIAAGVTEGHGSWGKYTKYPFGNDKAQLVRREGLCHKPISRWFLPLGRDCGGHLPLFVRSPAGATSGRCPESIRLLTGGPWNLSRDAQDISVTPSFLRSVLSWPQTSQPTAGITDRSRRASTKRPRYLATIIRAAGRRNPALPDLAPQVRPKISGARTCCGFASSENHTTARCIYPTSPLSNLQRSQLGTLLLAHGALVQGTAKRSRLR